MKAGELVVRLEGKGLKQHEIAAEIGVTQATVNRWKTKGSEPRNHDDWDELKALAIRVGVMAAPSPADAQKERRSAPSPNIQAVPLLSWVSAGRLFGSEVPANVRPEKRLHAVDLPRGSGPWVALKVVGNSMNLIAPEDSIIFVDVADKRLVEDGFYVFRQETGDATFKRYRGGRRPRLQPYSTDPDQETIPAPEDVEVVGRVKRVVHDLI